MRFYAIAMQSMHGLRSMIFGILCNEMNSSIMGPENQDGKEGKEATPFPRGWGTMHVLFCYRRAGKKQITFRVYDHEVCLVNEERKEEEG